MIDPRIPLALGDEVDQLHAELNEQARLLGISAEKELALRAENERLKAELAEAKKDAERYRWIPVDVSLPPDETPVLILLRGECAIGERRWEHPNFEDTFKSYWYWDNPTDDGQDWERQDVTHWMPLPDSPATNSAMKGK